MEDGWTFLSGGDSLNLEELDAYWHAWASHAAIFRALSHSAPARVSEGVSGNSSHLHMTPEAPIMLIVQFLPDACVTKIQE